MTFRDAALSLYVAGDGSRDIRWCSFSVAEHRSALPVSVFGLPDHRRFERRV
ncbi:MAG TPA: hypothetical protein VKB79_07515 [Bryobacteraceae bacterium]|nr:hypothetical protein [Bryobacteraceae bacterium]